jgi:beta-1,4-mannosyl-glycoprotein beta-1,4-N-acetylglucosaminyltransferase
MIIDSFLFGWELDLLEMRLIEMNDFVDVFILIESNLTFQGESKPLYYQENKDRFSKWSNKIISINAPMPVTNNPWEREYASREALKMVINKFPANGIILHGDVDEIMSANMGNGLQYIIQGNDFYVLDQKLYSMAVDWLFTESWQGTMITRKHLLDNISITDFRNKRIGAKKIRDGWHFTWLGGSEFIERKARSFSHTEDEIQSYIRDMGIRLYTEGYHVRGEKLIPVDIDDTYPKYIRNNLCPKEWLRPR